VTDAVLNARSDQRSVAITVEVRLFIYQ